MKKILFTVFMFLIVSNMTFAQDETSLVFTVQPSNKCLQKNESYILSCTAECGSSTVFYRWYSTDNNGTSKTPISEDWSTDANLTGEPFSEKGIRYYICGATIDKTNIVFSDVVAAAYSGLPILVIETIDHEEPTAEPVWNADHTAIRTIINETKVPGSMQIYKDGKQTYNSGEYEKKKSGLTIKLRGNTSTNSDKKPYKIKLEKKADLLAALINRDDESYKDKEWVLLKGATDLKTFIGFAVADFAGIPWTPKMTFVNVVMNGDYRGTYLLVEAIKQGPTHIDVADNGYIIEKDPWWQYEDVSFKTARGLHFTFKYPDEEDINKDETLLSFIKSYMNKVEKNIQGGTYEKYIDVESFARWQLIHDILGTRDGGGSNIYMTKHDQTTPESPYDDGTWSKVAMSTPWDFDSILSTPDEWAANHGTEVNYSDWLFANSNIAFFDSYKEQWSNLSAGLCGYVANKMAELQNTMGEDIDIARMLDAVRWNTSFAKVERHIYRANEWFSARVEWLNGQFNRLIVPDFTSLTFKTEKNYDGSNTVAYSGTIGIKNTSIIKNGDEISINIASIAYDAETTAAKKIVVQIELDGKDKDKYELLYNKREFPAQILPQIADYGVLTISTDQNGTHAVLNGNSTSALSEISTPITVDDIVFDRKFTIGKPSTIVLPFTTSNYSGGKFYAFTNVSYDEDNTHKWYADLTEEASEIIAHKPYVLIPDAETLTFSDGVTIEPTKKANMTTKSIDGNWTFKGVYEYHLWTDEDNSKDYGFAGVNSTDGSVNIAIGDFVHVGVGATIKPFRCYLSYEGKSLSKSTIELPASIEVRIVDNLASVVDIDTGKNVEETNEIQDDIFTTVSEVVLDSNVKVWSYDKTIYIAAKPDTKYQIIDLNGRILQSSVTTSDRDEITLCHNTSGIAIVRIANKSYKIKY